MTNQDLKDRIWEFEYYLNGFDNREIAVRNLHILKRANKVIADIIFTDYEENKVERHNKVEYRLDTLKRGVEWLTEKS